MTKTIEQKYQKLTDIEHVIKRPGMYVGNTKPHTDETWVIDEESLKYSRAESTWNPGLLKIVDEIVSNSVDEAKRPDSKLNIIKVTIDRDTGRITCHDNGGIPVVEHEEAQMWLPEMLFSELKAGSNFDDEEQNALAGQNGVGAALTNIFSKEFTIETADGKNKFVQTFYDNLSWRDDPKIKANKSNGTTISFIPDYALLNCELDDNNYNKLVKRVVDIAGCNPEIKVYLNGSLIKIKSFKDYIEMYTDEYVYDENDDWQIAVGSTSDGFRHVSFVNGTETIVGGTHIKYVSEQIIDEIRAHIKKKNKVDVKPSDIKNHMTLFVNARIINPRYSAQTKEDLITEPRDFGTTYKVDPKVVNKILKSSVIQDILDWVAAKEEAAKQAELRKMNKENSKQKLWKIEKFDDATQKKNREDCMIFFCEGDSAAKSVVSARDPKLMGTYAMKGKPLNVDGVDIKKLVANKGFNDIMAIMGLQLGVKVESVKDLRFGKFVVMTDADVDGIHICGLMCNMIRRFWPELFEMGVIYRFKTPLVKVTLPRKKVLEFFTEAEYHEWAENDGKNLRYTAKYYKGLGTSSTKEFKGYLDNLDEYLEPLVVETEEDLDKLDLVFNKSRQDDRKEWLNLAS